MNTKELMEKRNELLDTLDTMTKSIETEQRAFSEDEDTKFAEVTAQVEQIDKTLAQIDRAKSLKRETVKEAEEESQEDIDIRAFANIIRERADSNITKTDNGAVIPKTIANKIIDRIKDISPLFKDAEKLNVKGTLSIPYVDAANDNLTVAYATEFEDLDAKSTKLLSVDLTGYLAGVLAKVSISLLNSTDIDLVEFVVSKMASAAAVFIDHEILIGTENKVTGLSTATQIIKAGSETAITADVLIRLKNKLKSAYQTGAYWVMHPDTFTAVQLLKDGNNRYLFNDDVVEGFSGTVLGKPVYVSDQCPAIGKNAKAIFYINPAQALGVKLVEDSVQILKEKYATQHALGIVEWLEFDAKVQNEQAVAVLQMSV